MYAVSRADPETLRRKPMKQNPYLKRTLAVFMAVMLALGSTTAVYAARKPVKHKIAIDAGHQLRQNTGREPVGPGSGIYKQKVSSGTYGPWSKLNEYQLNLIVARKLETELKRRGYAVYMVRRKNNVNLSNKVRAQRSAKAGADILVRIHACLLYTSWNEAAARGSVRQRLEQGHL